MLLGENKEKFGSARYYWGMKGHAPVNVDLIGIGRMTTKPPTRNEAATRLTGLIADAEARTRMTCIACGAPGAPDRNFGYLLTLCAEHTAERKADRDQISMEIWPGDDDDMSIEIPPEREAEIARVIADRERVIEAATQGSLAAIARLPRSGSRTRSSGRSRRPPPRAVCGVIVLFVQIGAFSPQTLCGRGLQPECEDRKPAG